MVSEKKIFLDRNDDIRVVVDRLINASADRVILNIPKDSQLGRSLQNFQILKRESITAGKKLVIESIDDHVLELAALSKLEASNPIFRVKEKIVADILPRYTLDRKNVPTVLETVDRELATTPTKENSQKKGVKSFFASKPAQKPANKSFSETLVRPTHRRKKSFRGLAITLGLFIPLGAASFFLATNFLPRAKINLSLKKTVVNFQENVEISSKFADVSITNSQKILLPGELIVANNNLEMTFDAHGKKNIEAKAKGKLTVYNAYSSESQPIVKGTRFVSPDGKIFRLDAPLTIPAAKIENGKIIPSQITVAVTADTVGPDYNIPASKNWRIPGFQGGPKYEGFYAEAVAPMTGGFIGEEAQPTDEDVGLAREKVKEAIKEALTSQIGILLNEDLKFLEAASDFKILNEKIEPVPQNSEKFNLWSEGQLRYFVFKETMLKNAIIERAQRNLEPNLKVVKLDLNYENLAADFETGHLVAAANGSIEFESNIDFDGLKKNLLGVDEKTLRAKIFTLPGLERATVSLWPFWVRSVPLRLEKVEITAN